ncbi:uncharacterized protein isoform X2 [Danio rerio]|uniref:Uncharacterized protein isoform X2 n=1 Tax=Danio rerio TaxID=7955 RepID=A0AC58JBJ8_DANRE
MFAYVRYSDGHKHIVPIEDIKKFDPKNYKQNYLYLVRWENTFYQAQVLLIKETREEMEEELANPSKRIRTAKVLNQDDEKEVFETEKEKGALKKKNKTLRTAEASEKRKTLLKILEDRKERKREAPLFEMGRPKNTDDRSHKFSDSEEEVITQKIREDLQRKYRSMKKKKQELQEDLEKCTNKCAKLEKEKQDLVEELATYKSLNITLQHNIDEVLQRAFSKKGPSFLSRPSGSFESTPERSDELPNGSEDNNDTYEPMRLYEVNGDKHTYM